LSSTLLVAAPVLGDKVDPRCRDGTGTCVGCLKKKHAQSCTLMGYMFRAVKTDPGTEKRRHYDANAAAYFDTLSQMRPSRAP
jgi:hypothetical protein